MSNYGVLPTGWTPKPLATIASEVDTALKKILGSSAGSNPDGTIPTATLAGQLKALFVDGIAAMWDLGGAIYASFDPNQATGAALDQDAALTGTTRRSQSFSTVTATCTGVPGTVLNPSRVATVAVTGARFDSPSVGTATIAALSAWAPTTGYVVGNRVTNNGNAYVCTVSGTSAGSGGPTTTGSAITDGGVTWRYMGQGTGAVDVVFTAEVAGPIGALSGTLTGIATPVGGWQGVINLLDATVGALSEADPTLRARREGELFGDGNTTVAAIRARILKVGSGTNNPVTSCRVFYNPTDATDGNGLPPHSVNIVVTGGPDDTTPAGQTSDPTASVASGVWNAVGGGTAMQGNTTVNVTDAAGYTQAVKYTRPTPVPIYIVVNVTYDPTQWPATGAAALVGAAVKSAILTYVQGWLSGVSVRSQPLGAAVDRGASAVDSSGNPVVPAPAGSPPAPGIIEVPSLYIGTAPAPGSSATIPITAFQQATFDSSRITVNATPGTP